MPIDLLKRSLTLIGMSSENKKKCSSLAPPRSNFYKIQRAWQGVKLIRCKFSPSKKHGNIWYKFSWQNPIPKLQGVWKCPASCQLGFKKGVVTKIYYMVAIIQGVILFVRIKQNFYIKSIKVAKLNLIFWINSATITTPNMKEVCQLSWCCWLQHQ